MRFSFNTRTKTHSVTAIGTTPGTMTDSDNDGMDDRWELFHGVSSATANPDSDAFNNLQEFRRGSDPNSSNRALIALAGEFNGWNAAAHPMIFAGNTTWIFDLPLRNGAPGAFKFTAGDWGTAWGDLDADGTAEDWSDRNIVPALTGGSGIYRFTFDEQSWVYRATFDATDSDGDGLQDAWERYYNAGDAAADPDSDGLANLAEFRRGSSPLVADRMTVVGGAIPLGWNPDAAAQRMTWSDARQRWEWTGTFGAGAVLFKFITGPGWNGANYGTGTNLPAGTASAAGAENLSITIPAGRQRFAFNEFTGVYTVESFPVATEWREIHALPANAPWSDDSDGDGVVDALEYALGGNPRDGRSAPQPSTQTVLQSGQAPRLIMRWLQRTNDDAGLTVVPQMKTDLTAASGWTPLNSTAVANQAGDPPGFQRREVSLPMQDAAGFLRLGVTAP